MWVAAVSSIAEIRMGLTLIQTAYLFNAALSELRTELSVQTRNDGLALKSMAVAIRREVEQLEQKMKEDIQTLKHEYVTVLFFRFLLLIKGGQYRDGHEQS